MTVGNLEIDDFALLSGADIYSKELNLTFRQPTLKDIAIYGLGKWQSILGLCFWKKENQSEEVQAQLKGLEDFDCLYLRLQGREVESDNYLYDVNFLNFCALVFPKYEILLHQKEKMQIVFEDKETKEIIILNKSNYEIFRTYLKRMFLQQSGDEEDDYNIDSDDALAVSLKKKLEKRKALLQTRGQNSSHKHSALYNMVSSLGLDTPDGINGIFNFTLYQFYEQLGRYRKKIAYDGAVSAMLVGAQDINLESWYEDI